MKRHGTALFRWTGLALLGAVAFLSGCAPFFKTGQSSFYRNNPQSLLFEVERNSVRLRTLKGLANLTVESHRGSYNGRAQISFRQPDSLRIRINAAFGIHAATLLAVDNALQIYLPRDQILYKSTLNSKLLKQYLGMPLDFDSLQELVTGLPDPFRILGNQARLDSVSGNDFYFQISKAGTRIRMRLDARQKVTREYEIYNSLNGKTYRFKFSRFVERNGMKMPLFIQLIRLPERERISLFYEDARVNVQLKSKDFSLKVPDDVLIIRM